MADIKVETNEDVDLFNIKTEKSNDDIDDITIKTEEVEMIVSWETEQLDIKEEKIEMSPEKVVIKVEENEINNQDILQENKTDKININVEQIIVKTETNDEDIPQKNGPASGIEIKTMKNKLGSLLKKNTDNLAQNSPPLLGNMKNKLSSLMKLNVESNSKTNKAETITKSTKESTKPFTNFNILKHKVGNEMKSPKLDIEITKGDTRAKLVFNSNLLNRKLNEKIKLLDTTSQKVCPEVKNVTNFPALSLCNLKNKLGTALKTGTSDVQSKLMTPKKSVTKIKSNVETRTKKKRGMLISQDQYLADKKNQIFLCKLCHQFFEDLTLLRNHIMRHMNHPKSRKNTAKQVAIYFKVISDTPCDKTLKSSNMSHDYKAKKAKTSCCYCGLSFINLKTHINRIHKNAN